MTALILVTRRNELRFDDITLAQFGHGGDPRRHSSIIQLRRLHLVVIMEELLLDLGTLPPILRCAKTLGNLACLRCRNTLLKLFTFIK